MNLFTNLRNIISSIYIFIGKLHFKSYTYDRDKLNLIA